MKMLKKNFLAISFRLVMFLFIISAIVLPLATEAQSLWDHQVGMGTDSGEVGNTFGQSGGRNNVSDVRIVIGKIINVFLGFMGIVFLVLIVYGGFLWMSAAGNEDNVSKGKKTLIAGVIGLIIVVASFSIAAFVTDKVFMIAQ